MNEAEIISWNEFARDLRRRVRWDVEKVDGSLVAALDILPALRAEERSSLLDLGRLVAERSSKLAVTFLRIAPKACLSVDPSIRAVFLRWAAFFASQSRETLIEFLEKSPGILEALPAGDRSRLLDFGLHLASLDWAVSFRYLLGLPRIVREVPSGKLSPWLEEGLSLIKRSAPAAMAYYGLESQRSRGKMQDLSSAVFFSEVARPLKLFVQALTGKSLGLRPLREITKRIQHPFGPLPCTDGEAIFLPEVVRDFASSALNFSAFKLATAHQAGYLEFGTFAFKLSSVHDLFPPEVLRACLQGIFDKGKNVPALEAFFHLFPKKELARDLFHFLEGARVDQCLRREYAGLRNEMDLLLGMAMEGRPPIRSLPLQEAFLELILRITVLGEPGENLPWPTCLYLEDLSSVAKSLLGKGATVADAARATVILYRWLAALPNILFFGLQQDARGEFSPALPGSVFEVKGMHWAPRAVQGERPYSSPIPLPHRGQLHPELVQKKLRVREIQGLLDGMEKGIPLSPETLRELLEKGLEVEVQTGPGGEENGFQGLFLTDLEGLKKTALHSHTDVERAKKELKSEMQSLLGEIGDDGGEGIFYYDEWDYLIGDYRVNWCRLEEKGMENGSTAFVSETLKSHADLVAQVRRQFQMLKPERFKKIPQLERGEEIDLNAAIEASVDRRAGRSPSEKIYIERNRKERDFSTLFLLDMSASTDERANGKNREPGPSLLQQEEKKVIDIERETLVVMAEALKEIGDEYAIFGFSGYGRKNVEFYAIKDFSERYGEEVQGRIEVIKPQRSTRMGPAIRHAVEKIASREPRIKNLILISDGYPQDYDYGEDRAGKEYALQDTMMALGEAARKNIHTFCVTVDRAGHDYLRKMCQPSRYLVIEEAEALPRELPKIYRTLTT